MRTYRERLKICIPTTEDLHFQIVFKTHGKHRIHANLINRVSTRMHSVRRVNATRKQIELECHTQKQSLLRCEQENCVQLNYLRNVK